MERLRLDIEQNMDKGWILSSMEGLRLDIEQNVNKGWILSRIQK